MDFRCWIIGVGELKAKPRDSYPWAFEGLYHPPLTTTDISDGSGNRDDRHGHSDKCRRDIGYYRRPLSCVEGCAARLLGKVTVTLFYQVKRICPFAPGASDFPTESHVVETGMQQVHWIVMTVLVFVPVLKEYEYREGHGEARIVSRQVARLVESQPLQLVIVIAMVNVA